MKNILNYNTPKDFDWKFYLNYYEDLRLAGIKTEIQAKAHYFKHGKNENRIYKIEKQINDYEDGWSTFIDICKNLTNHLPKEFPKIDKSSKKKSLLIETRNLEHNEFVIKNTIQKLGDGWGHIIYCHRNNHDQIKSICDDISTNIEIRLLDFELTKNSYNNLMLNINFWNEIDCEKVLIYQTDTFICKNFNDDFLEFDYLGANWGLQHTKKIQKSITNIKFTNMTQGNGGLSLRSVSLMKKALNDENFKKIIVNGFDDLEKIPEDVYYSIYNHLYYKDKGNTEKFSIEPSHGFKDNLNFSEDPFGFHKIYNFIDGNFFIKKYEKKLLIFKKIKNISSPTNKYEIIKNHNLTKSEITVIITSYNYEKYIEKSIKSVIRNKLKNIEILVIDDNSSDNSLKKIINFLNKDINLTIIKKEENTGTIDTRNTAIKESLGDYIFMLDADNEIYEDCLIKHLNYLKSNDLDAVYSKIDCFDELNNFKYHISNKPFNYQDLKKFNYIDTMAMFNKKSLIELGCYDSKILELGNCLEDWELWLRLGYNNKKIGFINESLSRYLVKDYGMNNNSKYFENEIRQYLNEKFQ